MILIREIVQNAFATGCLTVAAEEQLRQLLCAKYDANDLDAFMRLQQAAMTGAIRQESREQALRDRATANRTTLNRAVPKRGLAARIRS